VNAILEEKWIKVQEGGKPKGPSDPKDHGRDKAHGRKLPTVKRKNECLVTSRKTTAEGFNLK